MGTKEVLGLFVAQKEEEKKEPEPEPVVEAPPPEEEDDGKKKKKKKKKAAKYIVQNAIYISVYIYTLRSDYNQLQRMMTSVWLLHPGERCRFASLNSNP